MSYSEGKCRAMHF